MANETLPTAVSMEKTYARNDAFVYRNIAGEAILVPVYGQVADMEAIYTLNEVGARIWDLLDGRRTLAEVCESLLDEYDVAPDELKGDVIEFVETMVAIEALRTG